ncbi:GGDEF domain-containing protein [Leucobacter sp. USHLN153]|uniref:GGDEF domain-containing protein n=1 Tax=Leucobacter sp. USHLN153 TaxID=3081268 RepID=UPI0030186EAF
MRVWVRAIWTRQNDRSIATLAYLAAGALFALLNGTLFLRHGSHRPDLFAMAIICILLLVVVAIAGRRFSTFAAGALMIAAFLLVVPAVLLAPDRLRALNTAMLFPPFFLYLVWFFPMWFARLLGYAWIGLTDLFILLQYGWQMSSVLMTLTVTGLLLGEVIGRFQRRLHRATLTDPLCDIWNARGFSRLLTREVAASQRTGRPLTMLFIDLDDFKLINDRHGHAEGDRALQLFVKSMQEQSRPQDVFARFGGDEFALLLLDADAEIARGIAERLHDKIRVPGWSYGIAEWRAGETAEAFIARADLGMLAAKRARKADRRQRLESPRSSEADSR